MVVNVKKRSFAMVLKVMNFHVLSVPIVKANLSIKEKELLIIEHTRDVYTVLYGRARGGG